MHDYFGRLPVRGIVEQAANAWTGLPDVPELLISDGRPGPRGFQDGSDGDNGIYLVRKWELEDSSLAVTVATFESESGRIVDTDILVNPNHPFGVMSDGPDQPADAFDLGGVLTHEMGHVLGLGESLDERLATMWPRIARGETHQRDIDKDDMDGAERAYAGGLLADWEPEVGACGRSSIVLKRTRDSASTYLLLAALLLATTAFSLRGPVLRKLRSGMSVMAVALLAATPFTPTRHSEYERVEIVRTLLLRRTSPAERKVDLTLAVRSAQKEVRLAAAGVLELAGVREEQGLASELVGDPEPEVRDAAVRALARLRTAPPAAHIGKDHPDAVERLAKLLGRARTVVAGEAVQTGTSERNGLIWSRYLIHGGARVVAVDLPGGSLGKVTQVVSGQELPNDGDSIVAATQDDGRVAWAHLKGGIVYGGWLGDGPAIVWDTSDSN